MAVMDIIIRAVDNASKVIDKIGNAGKQMGNSFEEAVKKAERGSKTVAKALAAAAAVVVGLGVKSVKLAADMEQTEIAFTTMLGSAEKAHKVIADLVDFAAKTPFEFPGLANAAKQLLAYGIEAEELLPTMRRLGDVSAGLAIPLEDIAYLYGTTRVQGRMFAQDVIQFTNRGIPIIQELAKQFDVTETEVKELVSAGKVEFKHLEEAIISMTAEGSKFGGLMEAQSASLGGLWATLTDNITIALTAMGNAIVDAFDLKGVIDKLIGYTDRVSAMFTGFAEKVKQSGLSAAISDIFSERTRAAILIIAGAIMGALVPAIYSFATGVWAALSPLLPFIAAGAALGALAYVIYKNWKPVVDFFKTLIERTRNAYQAFKDWHENLPGWAKVLLSIVSPITLVIANFDKISKAAGKVWSAVSGFFGWGRKSVVDEVTKLGGEAVGEVVKMSQGIENRLFQLQITGGQITKEFADEVIAQSTRMKEMAVQQIEEHYQKTVENLGYLRDEAGLITASQYEAMISVEEKRKEDAIRNQEALNNTVIARIRELQESGVEVTAEMRAAIEREIFTQRDAVIAAVADQEAEVSVILSKLRHESGQITAEMASEGIKHSITQRDEAIKAAEEQYENTIRAINAMSDEAIAATGMTRDELIAAARQQRDEAIKATEELHEKAVAEILAMNDEIEGDVDLTTGEILTGWDKFKIRLSQGASDAFWGVVNWFAQLPGKIGGFFIDCWNRLTSWAKDMKNSAIDAGKKVLEGFTSYVKDLPSKLWETLLEAAEKLLNIIALWENAKKAGGKLWEGFKKGLGIASPSYIERAIDAIAERSRKLPDEMARDFGKVSDLSLPEWNGFAAKAEPFGVGNATGGDSGRAEVHYHNHYNYYVKDVVIEAREITELREVLDFFNKLRLRIRLSGEEPTSAY